MLGAQEIISHLKHLHRGRIVTECSYEQSIGGRKHLSRGGFKGEILNEVNSTTKGLVALCQVAPGALAKPCGEWSGCAQGVDALVVNTGLKVHLIDGMNG